MTEIAADSRTGGARRRHPGADARGRAARPSDRTLSRPLRLRDRAARAPLQRLPALPLRGDRAGFGDARRAGHRRLDPRYRRPRDRGDGDDAPRALDLGLSSRPASSTPFTTGPRQPSRTPATSSSSPTRTASQLLNTRVPYGTALGPVSDQATLDAALGNDSVYVSDLFYGSVAKRYVFNVALPVTMETGERLRARHDPERRQPRPDPPAAQAGAGLGGSPDRPERRRRRFDRRRGNRKAGELPRRRPRRRRAADAGHLRRPRGRDGARRPPVLRIRAGAPRPRCRQR